MYDPTTLGLYIETDANGNMVSHSRDANGNVLSSVVTPVVGAATTTSATYNSFNEPLTQTDANGVVTTDAYNSTGDLCWTLVGTSSNTCSSVPSGAKSYVYGDSSDPGLPTSITDEDGNTSGCGCSSAHTTTIAYDSNHYGYVATSTDGLGNESTFTYDVLGRKLTSVTPVGNVSGCSCATANTTTYTYNPLNEVLTVTAPSPTGSGTAVTTNTYDADGNLLTSEDPLGNWTTKTYDADSELCWELVASSASSNSCSSVPTGAKAHTYDADGNEATSKDADGNVTDYAYNSLNQKMSVTVDPGSSPHLNLEETYTYDGDGNVLTEVSPDGNVSGCGCASTYTTTYTYDGYNRVLTLKDANGNTTTNTYDGNGNLLATEDAVGNWTTNTYDNKNRLCWTLTSSTEASNPCASPPSGVTAKTYDHNGNVLTVTDPDGHVTTNAYDGDNQECWTYLGTSSNSCSSAPTASTSYTYDPNGNPLTTTAPSSAVISYAYNSANVLCWTYVGSSSACGSTPTGATSYTYSADGQRLTMVDGTGTSTWTYNTLGQETSYTNGNSKEVQYTPDANGNQTKTTYADGTVISQAFNAANQICWTYVGSSSAGCSSPPTGATTYADDVSGNVTSEVLPNGVTNSYTYDGVGNISAISDKDGTTTIFAATYTRNADNLVTGDTSQPTNSQFQYTSKKQVCYAESTSSSTCTSTPTYAYDSADNVTTNNGKTQAFGTTNATADQLCWSVSGSSSNACGTAPTGATTYTYNTNGDRTAMTPSSGSATAYTYNSLNQLTQYQLGSGTATTYAYNGDGLRVSKTTGSSTTAYNWSDSGSTSALLEETTGSNTADYVYGPMGPIEEILPSGSKYYYSKDNLGSTRALTDSTGTTQDTDTYDPYGNLTSTGSVQSNLLFNGQYLDSESGLYYLRARYYDAATGQFLTIDPDVSETMSPYAYAVGDPINGADPSGLFFTTGIGVLDMQAGTVCHVCYSYAAADYGLSYAQAVAWRQQALAYDEANRSRIEQIIAESNAAQADAQSQANLAAEAKKAEAARIAGANKAKVSAAAQDSLSWFHPLDWGGAVVHGINSFTSTVARGASLVAAGCAGAVLLPTGGVGETVCVPIEGVAEAAGVATVVTDIPLDIGGDADAQHATAWDVAGVFTGGIGFIVPEDAFNHAALDFAGWLSSTASYFLGHAKRSGS